MAIKFFLLPHERNDATSYYIDLIADSLENVNGSVYFVDSTKSIEKNDIVIVITLRAYIKILKHYFNQPVVFWFQGVEPEELQMTTRGNRFRQFIRIKYFELLCATFLTQNNIKNNVKITNIVK